MPQTVAERTAEHIAESAHQASRATSAVADAIRDGVGVVRRAAKQGAMPPKNSWTTQLSVSSDTLC
jgi:hypothetical protein